MKKACSWLSAPCSMLHAAFVSVLLCIVVLLSLAGCSTTIGTKFGLGSSSTTVPKIVKAMEDFGLQNAQAIIADKECVEGRWAAIYNTQNLDTSTEKDVKLILRNSPNASIQNLSDGSTVLVLNTKDKQSAEFNTCYTASLFVITDFDAAKAAIKNNLSGIDAIFKMLGLALP